MMRLCSDHHEEHSGSWARCATSKQVGDELDVAGSRVRLALAGAVDTERWKIVAAEGGLSRIENAGTGEALGIDGGKVGTLALGADAGWRVSGAE